MPIDDYIELKLEDGSIFYAKRSTAIDKNELRINELEKAVNGLYDIIEELAKKI